MKLTGIVIHGTYLGSATSEFTNKETKETKTSEQLSVGIQTPKGFQTQIIKRGPNDKTNYVPFAEYAILVTHSIYKEKLYFTSTASLKSDAQKSDAPNSK